MACLHVRFTLSINISIGLQMMWSELRHRELDADQMVKDRLAFEFVVEEKLWKLTSVLDHFKL